MIKKPGIAKRQDEQCKEPSMSEHVRAQPTLDIDELRQAIQDEYAAVALDPGRGFHFHTGRPLARLLGYADDWLSGIPEASVESFAGTGNPFSLGALRSGEQVVDVGCGAGLDSLIASTMVGPAGHVIGVDMTDALARSCSVRGACDLCGAWQHHGTAGEKEGCYDEERVVAGAVDQHAKQTGQRRSPSRGHGEQAEEPTASAPGREIGREGP